MDGSDNPTSPVCVTGATGYIASFIVRELIQQGRTVHATVRNKQNSTKLAPLQSLDPDGRHLRFFELDLADTDNFTPAIVAAITGCTAVIHTATPICLQTADARFDDVADAERRQVQPAVDGARGVIQAAVTAGVRKVVLTSSTAAMIATEEPVDVLDESCWSDVAYASSQIMTDVLGAYRLAKTLQERMAWEVAGEAGLSFVSVNPAFVTGPSLTPHVNIAERLFVGLCRGEGFPYAMCRAGYVPDYYIRLVDVRDVAVAHVRSLETGVEGRFLLLTEVVHCADIVRVLREVDRRFVGNMAEVVVDSVDGGRYAVPWKFDNRRARELGVCSIGWEETIRACGESIIERGVLDMV